MDLPAPVVTILSVLGDGNRSAPSVTMDMKHLVLGAREERCGYRANRAGTPRSIEEGFDKREQVRRAATWTNNNDDYNNNVAGRF